MSLAGVLLVSLTAEGTMELMEKMVDEVNTHRLKAECFGEVNKMNYDVAIGKTGLLVLVVRCQPLSFQRELLRNACS